MLPQIQSTNPPDQIPPSEPGVFLELQASSNRREQHREAQGMHPHAPHTHTHTKSPLNHPHISFRAPDRSRLQAVYTRHLTPFQDAVHLKGKQTHGGRSLTDTQFMGHLPRQCFLVRKRGTGPSTVWTTLFNVQSRKLAAIQSIPTKTFSGDMFNKHSTWWG